jgi:uncharacterized membrane protein
MLKPTKPLGCGSGSVNPIRCSRQRKGHRMATVLFIIVVILVVGPILYWVIRSIFKAAGRNRSR